jgi:hypothetical protein
LANGFLDFDICSGQLGPKLCHVNYFSNFPPFWQNQFVISHLCLTVPPLAALGATALVGDLLPAPTVVELGAAG